MGNQEDVNAITGFDCPSDNPQDRRPSDGCRHSWTVIKDNLDLGRTGTIKCRICKEERACTFPKV